MILNRDKKHNEVYQKITKKKIQRQNINNQINSRFTPATYLKIGTFVLIPNFTTQKIVSKKLQPLRKGPYQTIDKPTDVTYNTNLLTQVKEKLFSIEKITYYPIIQKNMRSVINSVIFFYSFKIVQNNSENEQNQNTNEQIFSKSNQQKKLVRQTSPEPKTKTSQKEKNRKMTEKILPQDQKEKSEHRESSRLRSQPRKTIKHSFHNLKY